MTLGPPPDGWRLDARITPGDAAAEESSKDVDLAPPPAWKEAASEVRTVVKWLIGAFAAVGAVMFAKGFVTTPSLSWRTDQDQLVAAWVVGCLGLLALGVLIYLAVDMLRPTLFELADLPADYVRYLDDKHDYFLPERITSVAHFREALNTLRTRNEEGAAEVRQCELAVEDAAKSGDQAAKDKADHALAVASYTHDSVVRTLAVYNRVRGHLIDRAAYWKSSRTFTGRSALMIAAAVLAAAGGIGYQLLLATPEEPEKDPSSGSASSPAVGELVRQPGEASDQLWEQLGLEACQADADADSVAVVVASGTGTTDDPYVVSTLPSESCRAITFSVIDEVARVVVPVKETITYTVEPTGED